MPVDVGRNAVDVLLQLPREAALPDPGNPDHRGEAGAAIAGCRVQQVLEELQLLIAADERRLDPAVRPRPAGPR